MKVTFFKFFAAAIVLSSFLCVSCENQPATPTKQTPTSEIGVINRGAIMKMAMFMKAEQKIATAAKTLEASYASKMNGLSREQQQSLYARYEREVAIMRNKELKPLMDRAQAAIALVAQEKKLTVIIDKGIVVTGSYDITEDVKTKIKTEGELPAPEKNIGESSKIGYFAQDVVRNLRMFTDIEKKLQQDYQKLKKEADAKAQGLERSKQEELYKAYEVQMLEKRNLLTQPLIDKVNKNVEDIAKKENIVLVLDSQYVMYGGKNITDKVVESLNTK